MGRRHQRHRWRNWLAGRDFGQLAVSDPGNGAPHVIPTHFAIDGDTLLVHLARPNKVWPAVPAVRKRH